MAKTTSEKTKSQFRLMSLRTKIILILLIASLLIAGSSTVISFMLFRDTTLDEHIKLANGIAEAAASSIDSEKVPEYIEYGESQRSYRDTEEILYKLKNSSPDIQYLYVYKIMDDGCHVVFDLDTADMKGSEPGEVIAFENAFKSYVPALLAGQEIDPIISEDSYGWLLTVYKPVYDDFGNCSCYAAVDISMNLLREFGYRFLIRQVSIFIGFFLLTVLVATWIVERSIIRPINSMAYCANAFAYDSESMLENNVEHIKSLNIRTGDEIENLYNAMVKTTEDSLQHTKDVEHQTKMISEMQNGLIMVLADLVESRDKCTGDHVRKTAAYVKIIVEEMKKRGFYADQLTDEFVQNVIDSAPLHDVGKIHIADRILNKPGKLTDEEFDIMKTHTTVGGEIIDHVIEMVPQSGYLHEAKNLAEYHHEKWNGKGYPHGLSGENIPLSARIMAVADVFDALVSRRSYKQPFTFEKAMSIIKEDAGTHFDPLVAQAFIGASDKVRAVAEEFDSMNDNVYSPDEAAAKKAFETERLAAEAERTAAAQKLAEAERIIAAQKAAEAERIAAAQKAAEEQRAAASKTAETGRFAAAQKAAEAEKIAIAKAAAKKAADAQRAAAAQKAAAVEQAAAVVNADAPEDRVAAAKRAMEEQRAAARRAVAAKRMGGAQRPADTVQRSADTQRAAAAQKAAEEQRAAAAQKAAEEQRAAAAQKAAEEQRAAAAQKAAEEQRAAAAQKAAEEQRPAAAQKAAEEQRAAAAQKPAAQKATAPARETAAPTERNPHTDRAASSAVRRATYPGQVSFKRIRNEK